MRLFEIASSLQVLAQIHKPAFLWGPPGVGKSQVAAQVATALGIRLIDIRAILLDPVDLRSGRVGCLGPSLPSCPRTVPAS
jgi:replication-associated recombination protein RarA